MLAGQFTSLPYSPPSLTKTTCLLLTYVLNLGVNAVDHTVPSNNTRLTLNAYVCSCSTSVRHFPVRQFPVRHFPVRHFPVLQIPPLRLRPSFSSPANSSPANSAIPPGFGARREWHLQKLLSVYTRRLATYSRCQTLYRSKCTKNKLL